MRDLTEHDTDLGDMIDIDEFIGCCVEGAFIDYDGFGNLIYEADQIDDTEYSPSDFLSMNISEDVTHVLWYNR